MISEVENIANGQFVVKSDLKQIAVSTTNLTPDELGISPLERKGAFVQAETQPNQVINEAPNEPLINDVQVPVQSTVEQPAAQNVAPEVPAASSEEALESINYGTQNNSEILTNSPVDVVATTGLDQIDISSIVEKPLESLSAIEEKPAVEENINKMEMPKMDTDIKAQEPVEQDARLFENAATGLNAETSVGDTPFTVPTLDNNVVSQDNQMPVDEVSNLSDNSLISDITPEVSVPIPEIDEKPDTVNDFPFPSFEEENVVEENLSSPETPVVENPINSSDTKEEVKTLENLYDKINTLIDIIDNNSKKLEDIESKLLEIMNSNEHLVSESNLTNNAEPETLGLEPEPVTLQTPNTILDSVPTNDQTIPTNVEEPPILPNVLGDLGTEQMQIDEEPVHTTFI